MEHNKNIAAKNQAQAARAENNPNTRPQPARFAEPVTLIAAISAGIALLKELIPQLQDLVSRGDISAEDQQKLMDEYESLKKRADGQFTGPEWGKSGR